MARPSGAGELYGRPRASQRRHSSRWDDGLHAGLVTTVAGGGIVACGLGQSRRYQVQPTYSETTDGYWPKAEAPTGAGTRNRNEEGFRADLGFGLGARVSIRPGNRAESPTRRRAGEHLR